MRNNRAKQDRSCYSRTVVERCASHPGHAMEHTEHGIAFRSPLRWGLVLSVVCAVGLGLARAEFDPDATVDVGRFSAAQPGGPLPAGWKPLTFKKIERYTVYRLIEDEGTTVVEAVSEEGASGMTREVTVDLKQHPYLSWRWKVTGVLRNGDVSRKEGDDYPARIYITFEYDGSRLSLLDKVKYQAIRLLYGQYPPLGAINYIWGSHADVGAMVPNPYTDQVMMFVVESGTERAHEWVSESRNVYEDYKQAFNQEPPLVSGVAIMTDTDNTKESAVAYYGDIAFGKTPVDLD